MPSQLARESRATPKPLLIPPILCDQRQDRFAPESFATKALAMPLLGSVPHPASIPPTDAKYPVSAMSPLLSTATVFATSAPLPPKVRDHRYLPLAISLTTNTS